MNIVFFGTSEVSVSALESLIQSPHRISRVVTVADKPQGRHLAIKPSPLKEAALKYGIPLYQFEDVNSGESLSALRELDPGLFVVVSFGRILSGELIGIAPKGAINLHFSNLPLLRGAAPIQRAIAQGFDKTGVSVFYIEEKLDTGDIILQRDVLIRPDDNSKTLSARLMKEGSQLLLEAMGKIESGEARGISQDHGRATYAHKYKKEEMIIDWTASSREICDLVRALDPKPNARAYLKVNGRYELIKICRAGACGPDSYPEGDKAAAGEILEVSKDGIAVKTGDGAVRLLRLQVPGKKETDVQSFINGYTVGKGDLVKRIND
ncbi:methionyl-tRNA formyltransferase [Candidatus Auribacterota bacterium]